MGKTYFDAIIIVPLEEEFQVALEFFQFVEDLSTATSIRFRVAIEGTDLRLLLVKQEAMGKTATQMATFNALSDYDAGLLICVGIAGGLSSDVNIGDVCYTGTLFDVLDNAKANERAGEQESLSFSPTFYDTPTEISTAIRLDRLNPQSRVGHEQWVSERYDAARSLITEPFHGKRNKWEEIRRPSARDTGPIACAAVTGSPDYNARLLKVDRKVLAVETESGGLFSIARELRLPALTIRGISDYAGTDKNRFEQETNNQARVVAAANACSFLARQLSRSRMLSYLSGRRDQCSDGTAQLPLAALPKDRVVEALVELRDIIDDRLKELSPSYALKAQGYRLPVPRIRVQDVRSGLTEAGGSQPIEVRDALRDNRVITIRLPKEYPDQSLAWIIGQDLISAQVLDRQVLPVVIEAKHLQRPRAGVVELAPTAVSELSNSPEVRPVYIIDSFDFSSETRTDFLVEQLEAQYDASFVIVTRSRSNLLVESEFISRSASAVATVCDVSFLEISHFLQKNFAMAGAAAGVVAARLRETFQSFDLPAHPSYFAGIPQNALDALLEANRRAELIEIAVVGYLTYVVAGDKEPVALSRKTRERFLGALAFQMNVEKRSFTEADVVSFAQELADRFDFNISPARFASAFIDKGILHVDDGRVEFTLPFMESYLLAKTLHASPSDAMRYFELSDPDFDFPTFTLYAEMGAADKLVDDLRHCLDEGIAYLAKNGVPPSVLLGATISPALLARQEQLQSLQRRLNQASEDVRADRDDAHEKQRLLDASDRIREDAAKRSADIVARREGADERRTAEMTALLHFRIAVTLLGSGAERLEGSVKRAFIEQIVRLAAMIIADWTSSHAQVDFSRLKEDILNDEEFVQELADSGDKNDLAEARRILGGLVDMLEFTVIAEPFRRVITTLCEEARDTVLAESIARTEVLGEIEALVKSAWHSDIDTPAGKPALVDAIKSMPKARFVRVSLAAHLIGRVVWKQWRKADRLMLLDAADQSLMVIGKKYDRSALGRIIDERKKDEDEQ